MPRDGLGGIDLRGGFISLLGVVVVVVGLLAASAAVVWLAWWVTGGK